MLGICGTLVCVFQYKVKGQQLTVDISGSKCRSLTKQGSKYVVQINTPMLV